MAWPQYLLQFQKITLFPKYPFSFETQGTCQHKSKTWVSVVPQKGHVFSTAAAQKERVFSKIFFKKKITAFI